MTAEMIEVMDEAETVETEVAETGKRTGFAIPLNRKVTPDMLQSDIELAYQITVNRVADAFTSKDQFLKFCEEAWQYKQDAKFQQFDTLLDELTDEQKQALINRLQKPKTTARKKTVITED
jgi:hypothetical protein